MTNEEDVISSKGAQRDNAGRTKEVRIGQDAAGTTPRDLQGGSEAFRGGDGKKIESRSSSTEAAVAGTGRTPSVAQRLRRRMVARLEERATLLL